MADYTIAAGMISSPVFTLAANTVTTVTFADAISAVDIMSDGAADIFYTLDGSTPTVGGANCFRIPVNAAGVDSRNAVAGRTPKGTIKLISSGTPTMSVHRGD